MLVSRFTAQSFQRPELQLLYRAFGPSELLRDFTNTSLINKAAHYHQSLVGGKTVHQLEEHGPPFHFCNIAGTGRVVFHWHVRGNLNASGGALPAVSQRV